MWVDTHLVLCSCCSPCSTVPLKACPEYTFGKPKEKVYLWQSTIPSDSIESSTKQLFSAAWSFIYQVTSRWNSALLCHKSGKVSLSSWYFLRQNEIKHWKTSKWSPTTVVLIYSNFINRRIKHRHKTQNPLASLDCEPLIIMYVQHGWTEPHLSLRLHGKERTLVKNTKETIETLFISLHPRIWHKILVV